MNRVLSILLLLHARGACHPSKNKLASEGEICGGPIEPSIQCKEGLECFYPTNLKDLPGICRAIPSSTPQMESQFMDLETPAPRYVGKGQHCGGFIMNAPKCAIGLTCILGTVPDAGGTCE